MGPRDNKLGQVPHEFIFLYITILYCQYIICIRRALQSEWPFIIAIVNLICCLTMTPGLIYTSTHPHSEENPSLWCGCLACDKDGVEGVCRGVHQILAL